METPFKEIRKFNCPELIFGVDSRKMTGKKVKMFGAEAVLLVTSQTIMGQDWFKEIAASLKAHGVRTTIFASVSTPPRDTEVMAGVELFGKERCKCIAAVGGGSVIDCAKAIGVVVSNDDHITHFKGIDTIVTPMPPLVCVPSTFGVASDVTQYATIIDTSNQQQFKIISKLLIPDISISDPVTLSTLGKQQAVLNGFSALCHAVEACVSNLSSPLTNGFALDAVKEIYSTLDESLARWDDITLKSNLMMAGLKSGLAFSNAGLGTTYVMAHVLAAQSGVPYGYCNLLLAPVVLDFNFESARDAYTNVADMLGINTCDEPRKNVKARVAASLDDLRDRAGANAGLPSCDFAKTDIPSLVKRAFEDLCNATNPKAPLPRDLEKMYEQALKR